MKNYITGKIREIKAIATGAVVAGDVVTQDNTIGIAVSDAESGEEYLLRTKGVYEVPKAVGALAAGETIGWTGTEARAATTGDEILGVCYQAAGATDATVRVDINATLVETQA